MLFSTFTLLALPLAALSSPVATAGNSLAGVGQALNAFEKRADNAAGVLNNLKAVLTDVNNLNQELNSIPTNSAPTISQLQSVEKLAYQFAADINATIATTNSSSAFTAAESTSIYNYLNQQLYSPTNSLMQNFIAHKPGFAKFKLANIVKTVHDALVLEESYIKQMFAAITLKSTGPAKTKEPALGNKFVQSFDQAIAAYASS